MLVIFCLSRNFWSFPVEVLGMVPKITFRGHLKCARLFRLWVIMSSSVVPALGSFNSIKAQGLSPHFSSGLATTAAVKTFGCIYRAFSTSMEEMFSPPEIMMSLDRSFSSI